MNRITKKFDELKKNKRKALIPYVTAGDPSMETTLAIMRQLVISGADILEIGMPFSDPVADGVVIQSAHQRALQKGMSLIKLFELIEEFRKTDMNTPIVLMTYINPIETMGYNTFITKLTHAKVDGVLIVDLPIEEGAAFTNDLKQKAIAPIFLIAPTTSAERAKAIAKAATGFLYLVSLKGVTGTKVLDVSNIEKQAVELKAHSELPIAVGFGIRDGSSAKAVVKFADAVIVGSAYAALIEQNIDNTEIMLGKIAAFTQELRAAIDV